jgi:hypothetical protein
MVDYYSARSYVFTTPGEGLLFASLGDSNNLLTINTTDGGPCNRTTAIITTADRITASDIAQELVLAGLSTKAINIDVIPSSLVMMGRGANASTFMSLFRVAVFHDT